MRRFGSSRQRRLLTALFVAAVTATACQAFLVAAELSPSVYVKEDTWSDTMLASRAAYFRWQEQVFDPPRVLRRPQVIQST